jgi:hypothetical protein
MRAQKSHPVKEAVSRLGGQVDVRVVTTMESG